MDWVEHFLRLAKKLITSASPKIAMLQKEFEFVAGGIYQQAMQDLNLETSNFGDRESMILDQRKDHMNRLTQSINMHPKQDYTSALLLEDEEAKDGTPLMVFVKNRKMSK